ncbi:PilT protein domain protein [Hydrogenobaculum sp. Y04AAS1]|uniref:PIN domain-containing protein n=1 Tax=Hydrogenobaculum sp. (strain Y04AAS1) TaxID=380749 RepID=UPI00015BC975|nr:PilT protein domain protein [Hydrogenobaculum sp. Y04AAS1]
MLLLDTNIILEIALEQEKAQECVNLLEQYDKIDFFISDFSIHSIGVILKKRNKLEKFDKLIEDLRLVLKAILSLDHYYDLKRLINIMKVFDLDFDDAYQYRIAEKYKLTIVSFDKDFDKTKLGRRTTTEILQTINH